MQHGSRMQHGWLAAGMSHRQLGPIGVPERYRSDRPARYERAEMNGRKSKNTKKSKVLPAWDIATRMV